MNGSGPGKLRVFLGLLIGLAVIIYLNPPATPCRAQIDVYSEGIKNFIKPFSKALKECKEHPEPGGCLAYFDVLQKLESRLNEVSHQCQAELKADSPTESWILTSMELYGRLAWGSKPPDSYFTRRGWLDLTQVVEFCRLKKHLVLIYGDETWAQLVNDVLYDLPGASDLQTKVGQNEPWNRSLFSDPCQYPL